MGCVTDEVRGFLGPATNTLARAGCDQSVVMIDALRYRHHIAGLHESVELVMVPSIRNPIRQWRALGSACREVLASVSLQAIHLHGLWSGLIGAHAVRTVGVQVPTVFSPHASHSAAASRGITTLALALLQPALHPARRANIVNPASESPTFESWRAGGLIESAVSDSFFTVARREARHPLIVTCGRTQGARHSELFAQLAVLLGGEDPCVSFNWLGAVDDVSRARLVAANVGVFDVADDAECAARLAAGWIYLAPAATRGFALHLAEAMAAGLPCVALDCMQHREVIRDGETGYLCKTSGDMMECIATLVDDPALRSRISEAARRDATRRFVESEFGAKLLAAYAPPG
ncbi:MAG: glycosyltransferase [Burkholderiales bacterium]